MRPYWCETPRKNRVFLADKRLNRLFQQESGKLTPALFCETPTRVECIRTVIHLCVQHPDTHVHQHSSIQSCANLVASGTMDTIRKQRCTNRCTWRNIIARFTTTPRSTNPNLTCPYDSLSEKNAMKIQSRLRSSHPQNTFLSPSRPCLHREASFIGNRSWHHWEHRDLSRIANYCREASNRFVM